jgi:hypothetical protein
VQLCRSACAHERWCASSNGPKPAAAEAAEIPERSLIAAADKLSVRTQRGQWWLLG